MPSCFVMQWHCFMQLVVCMFLSIVLRSCSLTRLSSHALTLNEVDYLLETPKLRTCLALVVLTRAKRTFFGMTASCGSPPFGRCYVSVVVEVVVPAWRLFQQSCLSCGQGLVGRCPSLCTCFESFICAVVHSNPLSICSSTFSHTMQAIVCTKVKAMCCSVAMF